MKVFRNSANQIEIGLLFALLTVAENAAADGLDTWTLANPLPRVSLSAITYGQGVFVAVASQGLILSSPDGVTWVQRFPATGDYLSGIVYGNGRFVVVGFNSSVVPPQVAILSSADGENWLQIHSATLSSINSSSLNSVAYGSGQFVAVGYDGAILTSADAVNWIERRSGTREGFLGVAYGNGRFVAVGKVEENTATKGDVLSSPIILTSSDGVNWVSPVFEPQPYTGLEAVSYRSGYFVAVGADYSPDLEEGRTPVILTSIDATNWVHRQSAANTGLHAVTYASGQFVTVGSGGAILSSSDAVTWRQHPRATDDSLTGIAYGNGDFVAVGHLYPTILESASIINLALAPTLAKGLATLSLEGPTGLVYTIQSSPDLISWRNLTNITISQPTNILFEASSPATKHVFYRAYSQ